MNTTLQNKKQVKRKPVDFGNEAEYLRKPASVDNDPIVITVTGKKVPKSKCRKIADIYYIIGDINVKDSGECFMIDGTYYRLKTPTNDGKIVWNYSKGRYQILTRDLVVGLADKNTTGYFEKDITQTVKTLIDGMEGYAVSEDIAKNSGLFYDFGCGMFVDRNRIVSNGIRTPNETRNKPTYENLDTQIYSIADHPGVAVVEQFFTLPEASIWDKYFRGYWHGLEIETDGGWLPERYYFKYGAIPLRDGSIKGTEITTLIWKDRYTNLIKGLMEGCKTYNYASQNTSLHDNVGNVSNDPKFPVALYILYYRIQQEIEGFIPNYKRDLSFLSTKQGGPKDHCKLLQKIPIIKKYSLNNMDAEIVQANKDLFTFLNEGVYDERHNLNSRRHVKQGSEKWNWHNRYYVLNLIPYYFGKENQKRVEFRVHSGTVNPIKTFVWTLICSSIVHYTEENLDRILLGKEKITLEDVIRFNFEDGTAEGEYMTGYILSYIETRTHENYQNLLTHSTYGREFQDDAKYDFKFRGMTPFTYKP